jgi:hypothetical protein
MKAKKRQSVDFSAAAAEGPAPGTAGSVAPSDPPPEAVPDTDLDINDAPAAPLAPPDIEPALTLDDVKPLATLRKESDGWAAGQSVTPRASAAAKPADTGNGALVWIAATIVAALWAAAPIAFVVGYRQGAVPLQNDMFALAVFALLAVGPALLIFFTAYMLRQGARLSAEARRTRELANQMITPAAIAAAGAADAVAEVRGQIEHAGRVAAEARDRMLSLREALAAETAALSEAAAHSARTTVEMSGTVGREREAMQAMAEALDAQSAAITDAIGRQARMVAEASDLAETQLREAEAALAARAADLTTAAVSASEAARTGAEDVARQAARLEMAGSSVTQQLRAVDESISQQRVALTGIADALRAEQEDFAVQSESRAAQMADLAAQARLGAEDLGDTAVQGAESLRGLIASAAEQFQQLAERSQAEREAISEAAARSFEALRAAAGEQRGDLEQEMKSAIDSLAAAAENARLSAQGQIEVAKSKVDQLNEAAFAAGQRADAVFESRMQEARELIEQSAMMAEQAGARSAQRLDEGVNAARAAVSEVERLLADASARTGALGAEAKAQAAAVREVVEHGMGELLASARRAAEETQAIDAAFQERVKRNYDMLSEAVSLMGAVAGAAGGSANALRAAAPFAPLRPAQPPAPVAIPRSPATSTAPVAAYGDESGRQRLRFTPTDSDEAFRSVFVNEPATESPPEAPLSVPMGEGGAWTWKDLLGGLGRNAPSGPSPDSGRMTGSGEGESGDGRALASEIAAMGIDAAALLPRSRIDEIAAAVQTGDGRGAREVVKRLAPAAIRRLVRRLFSDRALRDEAEHFRSRYGALVQEAATQDRQGFLVATLLGSDAGRTYLLLDAAAGDLG